METSTIDVLVRAYSLKNQIRYFSHKNIQRDWIMLGAAWGWINDDRVDVVSVKPTNPLDDTGVIHTLHSVLSDADVLVGHNMDRFDIKKFNARSIVHGLHPIMPSYTIDTLKIARSHFAFTSNTLDYIASLLCPDHPKGQSPDWDKVLDGCPDEIRKMRQYNKQDIITGKAVYHKLAPYHRTHPNFSALAPQNDPDGNTIEVCPACLSPNIVNNGVNYTRAGRRRQRVLCRSCGKQSIRNSTTKRIKVQ